MIEGKTATRRVETMKYPNEVVRCNQNKGVAYQTFICPLQHVWPDFRYDERLRRSAGTECNATYNNVGEARLGSASTIKASGSMDHEPYRRFQSSQCSYVGQLDRNVVQCWVPCSPHSGQGCRNRKGGGTRTFVIEEMSRSNCLH